MQSKETQARWNLLSDFVAETCADRDESHGHAHMKAVAETSLHLIQQDFQDRRHYHHLMLDAITAAWLHDIADHKYDKDGTLEERLDAFGNKHISNTPTSKRSSSMYPTAPKTKQSLQAPRSTTTASSHHTMHSSATSSATQTNSKHSAKSASHVHSPTPETPTQHTQKHKSSQTSSNTQKKNYSASPQNSSGHPLHPAWHRKHTTK